MNKQQELLARLEALWAEYEETYRQYLHELALQETADVE